MWSAQFSAPYTIALALLGVEPGAGWFTQQRLSDPELSALARKIELQPYLGANGAKPSHHAASAEIKLDDGRVLKAEIEVARGEAANPLAEAVLDRKFLHLAAGSVGPEASNRALSSIKSIDAARSVRPLLADISLDRYLQTIQSTQAK